MILSWSHPIHSISIVATSLAPLVKWQRSATKPMAIQNCRTKYLIFNAYPECLMISTKDMYLYHVEIVIDSD